MCVGWQAAGGCGAGSGVRSRASRLRGPLCCCSTLPAPCPLELRVCTVRRLYDHRGGKNTRRRPRRWQCRMLTPLPGTPHATGPSAPRRRRIAECLQRCGEAPGAREWRETQQQLPVCHSGDSAVVQRPRVLRSRDVHDAILYQCPRVVQTHRPPSPLTLPVLSPSLLSPYCARGWPPRCCWSHARQHHAYTPCGVHSSNPRGGAAKYATVGIVVFVAASSCHARVHKGSVL